MGLDWKIVKSIIIVALVANILFLLGVLSSFGFAFGQSIFSIPAQYISIALNAFILWAIYSKYIN
jgi:hypothetical protein